MYLFGWCIAKVRWCGDRCMVVVVVVVVVVAVAVAVVGRCV
jgi:hypothetical protein